MKKFLVLITAFALVAAACESPASTLRADRKYRQRHDRRSTASTRPPLSRTQPTSATTQPTLPATQPTTPPVVPTPPVVTTPTGVPAPAAAGKQWKQTFGEEFDGTDYDHTKLTPCFDWNYGGCTGSFNQGREWYSANQIAVNDGSAKLVASPAPAMANSACLNGQCTYRSGLLSTARRSGNDANYLYAFTYGYVEARLKLPPKTPGFFTAFWMLPAEPSYSYRSEIDIVEALGYDPTTMYMNYHGKPDRSVGYSPNIGTGNNGACAVKDYSQGFSRFGLDWQPDHIAWYIDGVKCGEFTNAAAIENGPMQIILNLMVDHSWERDWGQGLKDPTLTRQLEVDYLRVYQQQ
ncbi:MAG: glycoside hydrolase family 16 protein [Acidimicrobiia bacterium]